MRDAKERNRIESKNYRLTKPFNYILTTAKMRAKNNNLPFDLDVEYLKTLPIDICPILKVKLIMPWKIDHKHHPHKATLDKIVPELGYVKGNVAFISFDANVLKSNNTLDTLKKIIEYLTSLSPNH